MADQSTAPRSEAPMPETTTTAIATELRTAAAKLREMAEPASRGPWFAGDCEMYPRWIVSEGERDENGYNADVIRISEDEADVVNISDADWQWMAFASPLLAEPLASWLETEAILQEKRGNSIEGHTFEALRVARAINGTPGEAS